MDNRRVLGFTMTEAHFYDHFCRDEPTGVGKWIAATLSQKIYRLAGIEPDHKVLEIGPGRGYFADVCLSKGVEYSAIEPNAAMAKSLEKKGVHPSRITCALVPPLPRLENVFDRVLMINVMEHVNSMQDALQTAQQIRSVLKPGGKLVICSPDYLNLRHNFFNCDFSHNYVTTARRLRQLLISAGFDNIKSRFLSGPLGGVTCFIVTALVARLPFGVLNAMFPESAALSKLYKAQLAFSRKVLIIAENPLDTQDSPV